MKIFLRPAPGTIRLVLICATFLLLALLAGEGWGGSKDWIKPTGRFEFHAKTQTEGAITYTPSKEVSFYNNEGTKELTVIRDSLGHWHVLGDTTTKWEYRIISCWLLVDFQRTFENALNAGWEPIGNLTDGGPLGNYSQTMKRKVAHP